ncbi:hypothetical protein KO524_15005, partial [Flavobacterium sp. NKUCC04_CG]|nr:hypothetical protein [Flavobacterium sp. NKUCC04_CG]
MKKKLLPLTALFISGFAYSQVGVGIKQPHQSAQMDIVSKNKGMMIPRIALENNTDQSTISHGNVNSLLVYNTSSNQTLQPGYYYWEDVKWVRLLIDSDSHLFNNTKNVNLKIENDFLILEDSDGNQVSIATSEIKIKNIETTLTNNGDGSYTYKNEKGVDVVIDVPGSVSSQFEQIIQNPTVREVLNQYLTSNSGNVSFGENGLTYIDASGATQSLDLSQLIKSHETLTTLTNNGNGSYTYKNEKGVDVVIDVPGSVSSQFEQIIQNPTVREVLNQYLTSNSGNVSFGENGLTYTDASGVTQSLDLSSLIKSHETLTTLTNNGNGSYTYKNEKGVDVVIDVPGSVSNQFEQIIQNPTVREVLNQYLTSNSGNVSFDENGLTYTDASGATQSLDLSQVVKSHETLTTLTNNGNGSYTYKNEKGVDVVIDVPGSVSNQFEQIIQNP